MSIIVQNLYKSYGSQVAVKGLSFRAVTGQVLGFLGPNGAGKSTTMKIMAAYLRADSGTVELAGRNVATDPLGSRRSMGYLPENNPLYLDMYVREFLTFIASLYGLPEKMARERVAEVIQLTGLSQEQHKQIGTLSKGYRQRVGLAQALVHNPPVLILDEPTSGLDPNQVQDIRALIRELAKEKTILFSSHILQEVEAVATDIVIIHKGELKFSASMASIGLQTENLETLFRKHTQPVEVASVR